MYRDVVLNEYGFYTLKKLPPDAEREAYYREKYYQNDSSMYTTRYTDSELNFFNAKLEQKLLLIREHLAPSADAEADVKAERSFTDVRSFMDVGCGEGFAVAFFKKEGFSVLGLDYSSAGIENHNRDILGDVRVGDVYGSIKTLIEEARTFDVINMDNVLEHVTDPKFLLEQVSLLLKQNGLVIIDVPNDFSVLQRYFFENGIVSKPHWVASPDHISYFNRDGLVKLCKAAGLENLDILGNFMTEFFILNPDTNYLEKPSVGKSCHFARVAQENIFHKISPQKTIELYRILGSMGLGREIIGVFKKRGTRHVIHK